MPFDLQKIETELTVLDWRDSQREAITEQLEKAFPSLITAMEAKVKEMSLLKVGQAQVYPKPLAESLVMPWAEEQSRIALQRAEESLSEIVENLDSDLELGEHLKAALPALAGVGAMAASALALPAVVSFAGTTVTTFFVIPATVVSVPLLLAGGVALTGLSVTGVKTFDYAKDKTRAHLVRRLLTMAQTVVFGYGRSPDARCVVNDLQALVLKAAQNKLEKAI